MFPTCYADRRLACLFIVYHWNHVKYPEVVACPGSSSTWNFSNLVGFTKALDSGKVFDISWILP